MQKAIILDEQDNNILKEKALQCGLKQSEFIRILIRQSTVEKIPGSILSVIKPLNIVGLQHNKKALREINRRDPNHPQYDPTLALEDIAETLQ